MYNPCIRGWITYYSHFYKTRLRPTLKRIDAYVIRWARRKFKRMRHQTKGARDWFDRLHRANPQLFAAQAAYDRMMSGNDAVLSLYRPNIGSRVNREVHARFWERLGVKLLRATRQSLPMRLASAGTPMSQVV